MELNIEETNYQYWNEYKKSISEISNDSFETASQIKINIELPESLRALSKMNVHNAGLLLSVSISKIFSDSLIPEGVSMELANNFIPLPNCSKQALGEAAKSVLTKFREHLTKLPAIDFSPCLVNFYQTEPNRKSLLNFKIDDSIIELKAIFPSNFQKFTEQLCFDAFAVLETIGKDHDFKNSQILSDEYKCLKRNNLPEIVQLIWPEIHQFSLNLDKSYIENGGDSIQAIRFLSRLNREGYFADLTSLFEAPRMSAWKIEFRGIEEKSELETKSSYPLSSMQQVIWEDWSAVQHQNIYHEQFLFKLDKCPPTETLRGAFKKIWNKYPQLRIAIQKEENVYTQTIQNTEADFRIKNVDSLDHVLKSDLLEAFSDCLMRCTYIEVRDEKYLLWSHHHVLLDGWSVGKLISEFIELIERDLPDMSTSPNHQYITTQREKVRFSANDSSYWEQFFKEKNALSIPKQNSEFGEFQIFSAQLNDLGSFKAQSDSAEVSLQSYFLTHFFLTIYSITGKNNNYLHSISSGRSLISEYAEDAIGLFIRNIIPGFELKESDTMLQLLQNVHRDFLKTVEMEFSDPMLVNTYQEQRPDVLFVFENYPYESIKGNKIKGNLISNHELTGYPISFLIMPSFTDLNIKIIYDSGKYSSNFISNLFRKFSQILDCFKDKLNSNVFQLQKTVESISFESENFPFWFDEIISKTSSSSNVISSSDGIDHIPFNQLESLAGKFENYFGDLQKGSRIAVYGNKNEKVPLLAYSIMRNGFVYVPINNAWPSERIIQTLEMAECENLILTDDSLIEDLPTKILVHSDVFKLNKLCNSNYRPALEDEAYLLFTSGTSGIPKGVSLSHANLSSFLDACKEYCNPENFNLIFSFTNIGFDLSIFENLFGFYIDKPIHVINKPDQLWDELQKYDRVLLNTVPSVIDKLSASEIRNVSVVHSAGEPFRLSGWKLLKDSNPEIKIFNWYGPTETTTYSTCIDLSKSFQASIGNALKNEIVFVADEIGLNQLDGLPGEIIIGGSGVGAYLENESQKFLTSSNLKFYRTGDRGYIQDGLINLLGRDDRQVKRLGQRFELSEIEQWISDNLIAVNRVYYHKSDIEQFILFVESNKISEEELRITLGLHFPAYMLPDVIILMPGFPENNNGKMDLQRMLELVKHGFDGQDFDNELLSIFKKKELIFKGLKGNQSFTSQGGDSILGLRLVGKMKKMGYQIEISDLLNAPTLNECFDKIKSTQNFTKEVSENTIHLSPVQKWFLKEYTGNRNHFNQSVLLELFLPMSESEIYEKVSHCFNSIDILQKVFDGNWKLGKAPIFEFIEINCNEEITAHCEKFQRSFNLSEGPVSAVVIFKSLDSLFLFISIHHFYCDGVTWRILMDHLQDSLSGTETNNTDTNIYGRVLTACTEFGNEDEKSSYYSKKAFNPFNHLKVSSYQDSEFRSIEWDIERSQVFQRVWNTGLSMNEKFVNFFLHSWLGANQEQTAIYLETHGRQYSGIPEIAETIGWFTQFYPLSEIDYPRNEAEIFDYVKQSFSNLPNQGLGYMGIGSWQKPPFPVLLNFLGSFDENWNSMARPVFHDQSNQVDPLNPMLAFFEVNGIIMEGKIKWMFRSHPEIPIDKIVEEWESTAKKILMNQDSSFYSDESIDKDDINRISDMLDILDL